MDPPTFCDPFEHLECTSDAVGACELLGDGSADSPCDDHFAFCDPGLYCDDTTSVCTPLEPEGAPCDSSEKCESGRCDFTSMICAPAFCDG